MGNCKDCKHWDIFNKLMVCALTKSDDGVAVHEGSLAVAYDTESYFAILTTSPSFGCVQFEKKA